MNPTSSRLLFSAPHDAQQRIDVFHSTDADDGSQGASIYINTKLVTRVFNPLEVSKWFTQNSRANTLKWIAAYHRSGLGGKDWVRPKPVSLDVKLAVPYYSQRDNERSPGGTCNVTSYAMAMAYLQAPRRLVNGKKWLQREDELEAFLQAQRNPKRDRHSHEDLAWMARQYGLDASFNVNRTWDAIRAQLRAGNPVIVSGLFTSGGHIIVLIGTKGNDFIVNDPWGNALERYRDRNGAGLVYDFAYMDRVVRGGHDSKWAHFVSRKAKGA